MRHSPVPDVSGSQQEAVIEKWAKAVGLWTERVEESLPQRLGEQIAEGCNQAIRESAPAWLIAGADFC